MNIIQQTVQETLKAKDSNKWIKAINEELESLKENKTCLLVSSQAI